jgi:hypothetical protein
VGAGNVSRVDINPEMVERARKAFTKWVRGFDRISIPIGTIPGHGDQIGRQVVREMLEAALND